MTNNIKDQFDQDTLNYLISLSIQDLVVAAANNTADIILDDTLQEQVEEDLAMDFKNFCIAFLHV